VRLRAGDDPRYSPGTARFDGPQVREFHLFKARKEGRDFAWPASDLRKVQCKRKKSSMNPALSRRQLQFAYENLPRHAFFEKNSKTNNGPGSDSIFDEV
jgi:hypothetical protein